jgi:uncharacterized protein (DUF58 family)
MTMPEVRLLGEHDLRVGFRHRTEALALARHFEDLVVVAKEVAASVLHGVHGRRRAGQGETFWQFRPFDAGEAATRIDWRRSAKDERLYVREREWEAAHTVLVWIDRSASMAFSSALALQSKADRAVVLGLAIADLLVRGGERVGLAGLLPPVAVRDVVERFAEAMLHDERRPGFAATELPSTLNLPRNGRAVLVGDFLCDPAELQRLIVACSGRGGRGHLVMISDPVEDAFPFSGHVELVDAESRASLRIGEARMFRDAYLGRLEQHRDAIRAAARARGWSFTLHRTDRPATEALLALRGLLEADLDKRVGGRRH